MHQQFRSYAERMVALCASSTNPRWSERLRAENCRHERNMGVFEDPDHVRFLLSWKVRAPDYPAIFLKIWQILKICADVDVATFAKFC